MQVTICDMLVKKKFNEFFDQQQCSMQKMKGNMSSMYFFKPGSAPFQVLSFDTYHA